MVVAVQDDPLLPVAEFASYCGVSERMGRRLIAERRVDYVKVGKHVRVRRSAADAFLAAGTVPASVDPHVPAERRMVAASAPVVASPRTAPEVRAR